MGFAPLHRTLKQGWGLGLLAQVWLSPAGALAQTTPAAVCPAEVGRAIEQITSRPEFQRSRWGILIQALSSGDTLYAHAAQQYFIPASNVKLLTTAAVLTQLGPEFRIRTSVYRSPNSGTLRVVGRGDPSFTDAQLRSLARQIHQTGITRIEHLLADDRYFQGDPVNLGWEWEDIQAGYGAPVTSLILNGNAIGLRLVPQAIGQPLRVMWDDATEAQYWQVVNHSLTVATTEPEFTQVGRDLSRPVLQVAGQLRVGSEPDESAIAIPDPTQYFLRHFRQALQSEQVAVAQMAIATDVPAANPTVNPTVNPAATEEEIAAIDSPPLSQLLVAANQESNNLYAESLLRQLASRSATPPSQITSSLEAGIAVLKATLTRLGVDPASYAIADGSGLSRHNLVSPEALVQTLRGMVRSPQAAVYRNSLAVAGQSGTLANRFQGTIAQGRLQGKTGAMSGVAALSGYLTPPDYPPLVLSILVNHFDRPVSEVRPAIDEIIVLLAHLHSCQ